MARTGENTYKRKNGQWEERFIRQYDGTGKPKYGYIYAKTYAEVKQKLAEQRCSLSLTDDMAHRASTKYEMVLVSWLQAARMDAKESTFSKYAQIIDRHILPALGQYPVGKIQYTAHRRIYPAAVAFWQTGRARWPFR